jgi:hypothetical protein
MTKKVQPPTEHEPAATTWEYESINTEVAARKRKPGRRRAGGKWAETVAKLAKQMRLQQAEHDRIQHEVWELTNHAKIKESEAVKIIRYQASGLSAYAEGLRDKALSGQPGAVFAADQMVCATEELLRAISELAGSRKNSPASNSKPVADLATKALKDLHVELQREVEKLRKRETRKAAGKSQGTYDKDYRRACEDILDAAMLEFTRGGEFFAGVTLPKHPFAIGLGKSVDRLRKQWVRLLTQVIKQRHEAGDFKTSWRSRETQTQRIFEELWKRRVQTRLRKHARRNEFGLPHE